jgi:rRNA maturation RNase YbeY
VRENAGRQRTVSRPQTTGDELHRVMIHGILHLLGYNDKTDAEKKQMRKKEDECLSIL